MDIAKNNSLSYKNFKFIKVYYLLGVIHTGTGIVFDLSYFPQQVYCSCTGGRMILINYWSIGDF